VVVHIRCLCYVDATTSLIGIILDDEYDSYAPTLTWRNDIDDIDDDDDDDELLDEVLISPPLV
jgi:hypothetical protein